MSLELIDHVHFGKRVPVALQNEAKKKKGTGKMNVNLFSSGGALAQLYL